jgi:uncharacterized RDD family membrane protein YckC
MPLLVTPDDRDADATWEVVPAGRRLAGYLLDLFFLNALVSGLLEAGRAQGWLPPVPADPMASLHPDYLTPILLFSLSVQLIYYFLWEFLTNRTPGKFICQTRVMGLDGEDPSALAILGRTFVRLVPLEFVSFLGPLPGGWHDRWTNTCVVRRVDNNDDDDETED